MTPYFNWSHKTQYLGHVFWYPSSDTFLINQLLEYVQISFSNNGNSVAFLQGVPGGAISHFPQVWRVWEQGCWRAASSVRQAERAEDSASVWGQQFKEGKGNYFIFAEDPHSQPFRNIHIFSPEKQWSAQVNSCLWCGLWDVVTCTGSRLLQLLAPAMFIQIFGVISCLIREK